MRQEAPKPQALFDLVDRLTYKPGWSFWIAELDRGQGSEGLTFVIRVDVPDSRNAEQNIGVLHYMIVPAAAFNEQSWRRWLLDQVLLVEQHEACEFFMLDDERPFAPVHAPGFDPYTIRELATNEERRTTFRGELSETL